MTREKPSEERMVPSESDPGRAVETESVSLDVLGEHAEDSVAREEDKFLMDTDRLIDDLRRDGGERALDAIEELERLSDQARDAAAEARHEIRAEAYVHEPKVSAETLRQLFEKEGIATRIVEIPGGVEFRHAIIFPRQATTEPLVRIYRGINHLDVSLLRQVPYALRTREKDSDGALHVMEHAKTEAAALADDPQYEHLIRFVDAVWPDLNDREVERFQKDLEEIEDDVLLRGFPLRLSLVHKTYGFTGGVYADTGIPPYLSASGDPNQAAGYGRRGLMVLEVPLSKIETIGSRHDGEIAIKGEIDPRYIAAILPRGYVQGFEKEEERKDVARAVEAVVRVRGTDVLASDEMRDRFQEDRRAHAALDAARMEADKSAIRENRSRRILARFFEARPVDGRVGQVMEEESVDVLTATRRAIYDRFVELTEPFGYGRKHWENYFVFETRRDHDTWESTDVHYSRNEVNDVMLTAMRDQVRYFKRRFGGSSI